MFFFSLAELALIAERSWQRAQGAKIKPKKNLGCLPPFFLLSLKL
jgi:hypothetical protein